MWRYGLIWLSSGASGWMTFVNTVNELSGSIRMYLGSSCEAKRLAATQEGSIHTYKCKDILVISLPEITTCQSVQQLLFEKGGANWFKVSESLETLTVLTARFFVIFLSLSSRMSG
jgi:hypothetical protein